MKELLKQEENVVLLLDDYASLPSDDLLDLYGEALSLRCWDAMRNHDQEWIGTRKKGWIGSTRQNPDPLMGARRWDSSW